MRLICYAHARRVSQVATATARTMDLPAPLIEQIEQAALLHDIGKLALAEQEDAVVWLRRASCKPCSSGSTCGSDSTC